MEYRLDLELKLFYSPPMHESGQGLTLMRTLTLPFPPVSEIGISGESIEGASDEPLGFRLEEIFWDVDSRSFRASTTVVGTDFPLALIPEDIERWTSLGWEFPPREKTRDRPRKKTRASFHRVISAWGNEDEEVLNNWPRLSQSQRPEAFNQLLLAIARQLVESRDDVATAYAIAKTKQFFTDEEIRDPKNAAAQKFSAAFKSFLEMSWERQSNWQRRILRTFPRLDQFVQS